MSAALVSRDALPSSRPPSPSSPSGVHARERRVNDALLLADLPLSVTLLLKLLSDAPDQVALIARAVEKNPLLADSILFLARAVLGPREACGNLAEAIVVLGARTIGLLAAAAGAAGMLDREVSTTYFMGRPRTMAALCRRVAPIVGMSARDASLCGLLCDVGEAILVRQRRRRAFDDLVQQVGFDHAALGECVLGAWGASEEVALAVRFHHDVACAYDAGPRVARLVAVVRFCDAVARRTSDAPGSRAESLDPITREESAEHLPVDASSMGALCGAVREVCAPYVAQEDDLGIHEAALPQELEAPCVTCGASSSMALCPCCEGTLCDAHGATGHGWCRACEETYRAERGGPERVLLAAASATLLTVAGLIATGRVREDSFVRGFSAAALLACALTTVAAVCVRSLGRARFRAVSKRWEKPATRHEEVAAEKARANVLALAPRMIGAALRRLYPLRAEHESSSARFVSDAEWIQPVVFMSEGRRKPIPQLWSKDGSAAAAKKETTAKKARTTTAKRATAGKAKETTVKRAPAKRGLAKSALAKRARAKDTFAGEKAKVKRTGRTKTSVATRSAPERKRASARNARKHGMMTSVLGFLRFGRGR